MGQVYKAFDPRLHREIAIKLAAERFSERFDREVRAIATLNPNTRSGRIPGHAAGTSSSSISIVATSRARTRQARRGCAKDPERSTRSSYTHNLRS